MFLTRLNDDIFSTYDTFFNGLTKRNHWSLDDHRNDDFCVFKDGDSQVVELVAPGLKSDDFDITLDNCKLLINVDVKKNDAKRSFMRKEKYEAYMGNDVDVNAVTATYDAGVLRVIAPLLKKHETKKIIVK